VEISTFTASNFAGEQFILWWNRGTDGETVVANAGSDVV
jgi:hypothetical protein